MGPLSLESFLVSTGRGPEQLDLTDILSAGAWTKATEAPSNLNHPMGF